MPSIFIHLDVAHQVAACLPALGQETAAFLFGAVAVDVEKMLGLPRSRSHFWDVGDDTSGALKLLAAHPHLAAGHLAPGPRAVVAGCLCHLVTDEQWTFVIYRRYFGRFTRYGGSQDGHDLQLGLQAVLESRQRAERPHVEQLAASLAALDMDALASDLLPFATAGDLRRWRDAVVAAAGLAPGVERFRYVNSLIPLRDLERTTLVADSGGRSPGPGDLDAALTARRRAFLDRLPSLQDEAARYVARDALDEFERRAVQESLTLLDDYLAGRPLRPPLGTTGAERR